MYPSRALICAIILLTGGALTGERTSAQETAIPPAIVDAYNEGTRLVHEGRYQNALERFEFVLSESHLLDDRHMAQVYNNMAYAHLGLGDVPAAMDAALKAVEIGKGAPPKVDTLGDVYRAAGMKGEMCASYRQACDAGLEGSCRKREQHC